MIFVIFVALIIGITLVLVSISYGVDRRLNSRKIKPLKKFPKVSIIIPAHNEEDTIEHTIKSALDSTYPNKEIIVINDCSKDKTFEIAKSFKGVKVINNEKQKGKAASLNHTFLKSDGDFALFLDADTTLKKDTIDKLVSSYFYYIEKGDKVGFVAPTYNLSNKKGFLAKIVYFEQAIHLFLIKAQMSMNSILSIRGCCLLVPRQAFVDSGGFSNTIVEDGDFAAKIKKAGYQMKYEVHANVDTYEPESIREVYKSRKRYGKGIFFCILNHGDHFLLSKQSFLSYYPYPFAVVLFFFVSLISISSFSFTSFYAVISLSGIVALFSTLFAIIGTVFGGLVATKNIEKRYLILIAFAYVFIYGPFAMFGYLKGALSGVSDKMKERGELMLKDW